MAKEENSDKKKMESEEVGDYESLLDDFTTIFDDSEDESGESKVDHDGLALSELLGEDVTMTTAPVEAEKPESGSEEDLSDFTQDFDGLDLKEFTESDETGKTDEKEEITIEDSTDETLTIEHGINELADIYGGGDLTVEEPEEKEAAVDGDSITQEIAALGFDDLSETVSADEEVKEEESADAGSTDTEELGNLDFSEISNIDVTVEKPEEETAVVDEDSIAQEIEALGFDDIADSVIPDEVSEEEASATGESADVQESEVLDFGSVDDLDVSAEEVKEEEFSVENDTEDTSNDTIAEEHVDDSATELILDEVVSDSDSDYASILDQLDGGTTEDKETLDVSDVGNLNILKEETLDDSDFGDLEILEDDDTDELKFVDSEEPVEKSSEEETSDDSVFMDLDLDLDDDEDNFGGEEEPAVSVASPDDGEDDFLGLSGVSSESGRSTGGVSTATEVLFEGVEMNFDKQVSLVTHAEILLAQNKTEEAAELLQRVAEGKGETHWVAKRLSTFGAQVKKQDTSE